MLSYRRDISRRKLTYRQNRSRLEDSTRDHAYTSKEEEENNANYANKTIIIVIR